MGMFKTFIQRCQDGSMGPAQIDDFIDIWHKSEDSRNMSLQQCIGLSEAEYSAGILDLEKAVRQKLEQI